MAGPSSFEIRFLHGDCVGFARVEAKRRPRRLPAPTAASNRRCRRLSREAARSTKQPRCLTGLMKSRGWVYAGWRQWPRAGAADVARGHTGG